jgi:hypothetical protein
MGRLSAQVCVLKAAAFFHGPPRIRAMADAFRLGCKSHGIRCDVLRIGERTTADAIWLYGMGPALPAFEAHPHAVRVVGDKGYFDEYAGKPKYLRVSVNAQQPDRHLQLVDHPADRWKVLGINVQPARQRGDYILLCGIGPKQCARHGLQYGQWERETYRKLKSATGRPIFARAKPGNPKIDGIPQLPDMTASAAIHGAWAVVCMTGNIGVDCIVEGVPVIAEGGPGSVYYRGAILSEIDTIQPMAAEARIKALSDVAYWQWTLNEITAGDLWANLRAEGLF